MQKQNCQRCSLILDHLVVIFQPLPRDVSETLSFKVMIVSPSQISSEKEDQIQWKEERSRIQKIQKREVYYQWFCSPKSLRQSHRPTRNSSISKTCSMPWAIPNLLRTSCMKLVWKCVTCDIGFKFPDQRSCFCYAKGSRVAQEE